MSFFWITQKMGDKGHGGSEKGINTVFYRLVRFHKIARDIYLSHGKKFSNNRETSIWASWTTSNPQKQPSNGRMSAQSPSVLYRISSSSGKKATSKQTSNILPCHQLSCWFNRFLTVDTAQSDSCNITKSNKSPLWCGYNVRPGQRLNSASMTLSASSRPFVCLLVCCIPNNRFLT